MQKNKTVQLIWGIALLIAGVGVIFRVPVVVSEIQSSGGQFASGIFFIKFCFYIIAVILIGGGGKKIYRYYSGDKADDQ